MAYLLSPRLFVCYRYGLLCNDCFHEPKRRLGDRRREDFGGPESISKQKREETENNTNCSRGRLLVGETRDSFGNPSVQRAYGGPVGQCKFLLECSVGRQPMSMSLYSHFFREVVLTKTVIYFSLFCDISMRNKVVPERSMLGWGCIPHS